MSDAEKLKILTEALWTIMAWDEEHDQHPSSTAKEALEKIGVNTN